MELRFDSILYSKLSNENSDAGHIKRLWGGDLDHGPKVFRASSVVWKSVLEHHPCFRASSVVWKSTNQHVSSTART